MNALIQTVNHNNFNTDVKESNIPVLVDFWAEWCAPCRAQNPILEELADELQGKLTVAKVNVDDNQQLAEQHDITSIPTMSVFQGGEVVHRFVGVQSKDQLLSAFNELNLI